MKKKINNKFVNKILSPGRAVTGWAREKFSVLGREKPIVRVLMYPAAEQNPYLIVTKDHLERLGAEVTMLHDLDSSELLRQAARHDILHIYNIQEYQGTSASSETISQISNFYKRVGRMWFTKRMGLKVFWTLYNEPKGNYASEWLEKVGRKWMFSQADRIIAPSLATRRVMRDLYPDLTESKVIHLPHHNFDNYFPRQVNRKQALDHLGIKPKGKVFICFGGIHPYKGLADVIPLFGKHSLRDHTLIVAGSPSNKHYASTIEGLCSRYDNVHAFLRYIPRDDVQYYLQAADIFVMPYKDVLNSGSTMLALSFGKPVVAPNMGMIPEILNPACSVLFDSAGSSQLRQAMVKSLDLDLERASAEARAVCAEYSAERLTRQLINSYLDFFPDRQKIDEEAEEL